MARRKNRGHYHLREWFCCRKNFWEKIHDGVYFSVRIENHSWRLIVVRNTERKSIPAKNSFHAYNMANKYMAKMEES